MKDQKVIVFQLHNEEYALDMDQVASVEHMLPITRVPQTESIVKGVINLRGIIIPVIDLCVCLKFKQIQYEELARIIVVYFDGMQLGLIVSTVNDVLDIPIEIMEETPAVDAEYIRGVVKHGHRLLILLDLQKILQPRTQN
jgi:purine-binding chemotaxis protein CheW